MTDYEARIVEARKAQRAVYLAAPEPVAADLSRIIEGLADAVEALVAERDALRAQLDAMTIDRPYVAYPGRVRQRLVGPWEDVPDPIDACRTSEGVSDGQQ